MEDDPTFAQKNSGILARAWELIKAVFPEPVTPSTHLKISGGGAVNVIDCAPMFKEISRILPKAIKVEQVLRQKTPPSRPT